MTTPTQSMLDQIREYDEKQKTAAAYSRPETKHSPAPWTASGDLIVGAPEPRPNPKVAPEPHAIAKMCWDFDGDCNANGTLPWTVAKHNQRLMTAAPELLQSLADLLDWCREHTSPLQPNSPHQLLLNACAAIQRATQD